MTGHKRWQNDANVSRLANRPKPLDCKTRTALARRLSGFCSRVCAEMAHRGARASLFRASSQAAPAPPRRTRPRSWRPRGSSPPTGGGMQPALREARSTVAWPLCTPSLACSNWPGSRFRRWRWSPNWAITSPRVGCCSFSCFRCACFSQATCCRVTAAGPGSSPPAQHNSATRRVGPLTTGQFLLTLEGLPSRRDRPLSVRAINTRSV
jgi:hypothetical protein